MTATKTRSDVHSPANFNPENYEYVGAYDNSPDPEFHRSVGPNYLKTLLAQSETARYGDGFQCDHCGAHIRYVGVFKHIPTGDHIAVGQVCTDNRFPLSKVDFDRLRKQAQLDREQCRLRVAWDLFKTEHSFVAGADAESTVLSWNDFDASENGFVQDVLRRGRQYGSISDRQLEAIYNAVIRDRERADREAAEAANPTPTVPVPTGKGIIITGKVVSAKLKDTDFGSVWKMLVVVDTPEGQYKVWGSCPAGLRDDLIDYGPRLANGGFGPPRVTPDLTVTFTANVDRSSDDEAFGFFSRPRKASVVARAT